MSEHKSPEKETARPGRGLLVVFSGPSGSGKTTIAHAILQRWRRWSPVEPIFSISATTRLPRQNETDGKDYFFITKEEFQRRVAAGDFIEWQQVYDDLYGSLKTFVEKPLSQGIPVVFDIDVNGALAIKRAYGDKAILIFLKPPSIDALRNRLIQRQTEHPGELQKRLERTQYELGKAKVFDYIVINDNLEEAISRVEKILSSIFASTVHNKV